MFSLGQVKVDWLSFEWGDQVKANALLTLCVLIGGIAWSISDHDKPSFSNSDISSIKESIRTEFGKREGLSVLEVSLIKESERRLQGFVKLKTETLDEVTKDCTAAMSIDDGQTIWGCR